MYDTVPYVLYVTVKWDGYTHFFEFKLHFNNAAFKYKE